MCTCFSITIGIEISSLKFGSVDSRERERARKGLDAVEDCIQGILFAVHVLDKVLEQLSAGLCCRRGTSSGGIRRRSGVDADGDLDAFVENFGDFSKVTLLEAARSQRRRANAHSTGADGIHVAKDTVLVERDVHAVAQGLELGAREPDRAQIPQNQMVVRAARADAVAMGHKPSAQRADVLDDLLLVLLELGCGRLQQRRGHARNLVVVRPTLQRREHGVVDSVHKLLFGKDETRARPAQRLVCGRRDNVAVCKRRVEQLRRDKTRVVRHVACQNRAHFVRNRAEARIVEIARVRRVPCHDQIRLEQPRVARKLVIVNQPSLGVHHVRHALKEDRGCTDALLGGHEPVRQMPARRQIKTHDAVVRLEQRRVHRKVRRRATQRLHIHAPLLRTQPKRGKRTLLAEHLDRINVLVAAIVARTGEAFRVLVGQHRAEAVHDGLGGEVLRGDQLESLELSALLACKMRKQLRIRAGKRAIEHRRRHCVFE
eukprot:comp4956_c0_seq1/m.3941 comp4956_c0_seq1/g.3941  ORF comp4956_c0_seq1/g.3941 comp4956_c0_seq1/m.3941 type:complete len:487 (+) comp4956_c0_seq1:26-1486(+)